MTLRLGSFYNDVRATVLSGLSTASSALIAASDTVLAALGKLQAQISLLAPQANPTFTGTVTIPAGASISGYLTNTNAANTYAPLASPALIGTPTAPTAVASTNTTQIANTAFVQSALPLASNTTPIMNGTAGPGFSASFARADHIHGTDTSRAPLASPAFTGTIGGSADFGAIVARPTGTAVLRSLTAQMSDIANVKDFGAVGDGVSDDTAKFQATFTWAQANSKAVYVPAGRYVLSAQLSWTTGALVFRGDGINLSILTWTAAAATRGLTVTLDQDVHPFVMDSMTLETQTFATSHTAISISGLPQNNTGTGQPVGGAIQDRFSPRFVMRDVMLRGVRGSNFSTGWGTHVIATSVLGGLFDGVDIGGCYGGSYPNNANGTYGSPLGIQVGDSGTTGQPTQFTFIGCSIYGCNTAITAIEVQGTMVQSCTLVGCDYGVLGNASYQTAAQPHIVVNGSHINANIACVYLNNMIECMITSNDLYKCSDQATTGAGPSTGQTGYGVFVLGANAGEIIVSNNIFANSHANNAMVGVYFSASGYGSIVNANVFKKFFSGSGMSGIGIAAGVKSVKIGDDNIYVSEGSAGAFGYKVLDQGTGTLASGTFVVVGKTTNLQVAGGSNQSVTWDQVNDYQVNSGMWSSTNHPESITVPSPGYYRAIANIDWLYTAGDGSTRTVQILVDGVSKASTGMVSGSGVGAGGHMIQNVTSAPIKLNTGDTLAVQVSTSSTAFVMSGLQTWFSVERLFDVLQ